MPPRPARIPRIRGPARGGGPSPSPAALFHGGGERSARAHRRHGGAGPPSRPWSPRAPWSPSSPSCIGLLGLLLLSGLACDRAGPAVEAAGAPPPRARSVILISLDTLRADHLSLYGYERETTPYLERLARESAVFERCRTVAPWTLIAHASLLTGLYPEQHGVLRRELAFAPSTQLLAERLREDFGHRTYGLYYEGWIHERHGFDRGFDLFLAHADAEEAGEHLEELVATLDPERPFFLFLHLFDAHSTPISRRRTPLYDPPPPYDTLFLPPGAPALPEIPKHRLWEEPGLLDGPRIADLVARYDGGIRYLDAKLEGWIEGWRRSGLLDDALLVVTSDHGEALGTRDGQLDGHGGLWREGLRVPLLVRHPDGWGAGERFPEVVSLVDVLPTVLEFVGAPAEPSLPGRSLFAPAQPGRVVLAQMPPYEVLIHWPWKMIARGPDPLFLFHLGVDRGERAPLTREVLGPELLQAARPRLEPYPPPVRARRMAPEEAAALRDLGYGF